MLKVAGAHPNIVTMQAFFEDQDSFYIVMEMCQGGELYHRLADKVGFLIFSLKLFVFFLSVPSFFVLLFFVNVFLASVLASFFSLLPFFFVSLKLFYSVRRVLLFVFVIV